MLLRRAIPPQIGKWTLPGGYVDLGETPAQAALRETFEEVGMRVTIERLLGVYADTANPVAAIVAYIAKPGAEEPGTSQEASEVRYFAADEIPWDEIAFPTAREALTDWVGARARAP